MSGYVAGKVWRSGLDGKWKPLAAALAECGNDAGQGIYPSIAYLSWMLDWSERKVQRGMKKLKGIGAVSVISNFKGGRGLVPVYGLDVEKLPQRPPWKKGVTVDVLHKRVTTQTERVTQAVEKDDTAMAPESLVEPIEEPLDGKQEVKPAEKFVSDRNASELWKVMRWNYKRLTGKSLGAELRGTPGERFRELVSNRGQDKVLAGFEAFLKYTGKERLREFSYSPIFIFIKQAEEWIDDANIQVEESKPEQVAGPRGVSSKYADL